MSVPFRMYKKTRPDKGDIVVCRVTEVLDIGSYVELLEYANIQGMIGISEISRMRIRSISKIVNVGKIVVAEVIAVDDRYIDLSKKNITFEQTTKALDHYKRLKHIQTIVRKCAHKCNCDPIEIYETYIWTQDSPLQFLKHLASSPADDSSIILKTLSEVCKQVFASQKDRSSTGSIGLLCLDAEGIDIIKRIIREIREKFPDIRVIYTGQNNNLTTVYDVVTKGDNHHETCVQVLEEIKQKLSAVTGGYATILKTPVASLSGTSDDDDELEDEEDE